MAEHQHIGAASLHRAGIVDTIVPEPHDPIRNPQDLIAGIAAALGRAMEELADIPTAALLAGRQRKYARIKPLHS
jgi:acetyl-CoA carboxylase alpha subunit